MTTPTSDDESKTRLNALNTQIHSLNYGLYSALIDVATLASMSRNPGEVTRDDLQILESLMADLRAEYEEALQEFAEVDRMTEAKNENLVASEWELDRARVRLQALEVEAALAARNLREASLSA